MLERKLQSSGSAWFVVYCYYNKIDRSEMRWNDAGSLEARISAYKAIMKKYDYKEVIEIILKKKWGDNQFGVSQEEVQFMAKKLLDK